MNRVVGETLGLVMKLKTSIKEYYGEDETCNDHVIGISISALSTTLAEIVANSIHPDHREGLLGNINSAIKNLVDNYPDSKKKEAVYFNGVRLEFE